MSRKPRIYLGGLPCHIIQRGNNRDPCFYAVDDYQFYLTQLGDACRRYSVKLHAYVLMTNHSHLLMTPSDKEGISRVMQSLGRRYVQYFNKTYKRTGTLWEGRHKSSLVDAENYLLACYRYIELNPVRANIVEHLQDYLWSSYQFNAYGELNPLVTPHPLYLSLACSDDQRQTSYKQLFNSYLDPEVVNRIRKAASFSMPLGGSRFYQQVETATGRSLGYAGRGRPVKRGGRDK